MLITILFIFYLGCNHHNNSLQNGNSQNQICFQWDQQQHELKCKSHLWITQYQHIVMKIEARMKASREHVSIHDKHEIGHLQQWKQRHFKQHHERLYLPFHGNIAKGVSLSNIWASHKCNGLNLDPLGGGNPTQCAMLWKRCQRPYEMMGGFGM